MPSSVAQVSNKGRVGSGTSFTISFPSLPTQGRAVRVTVWGWASATDQNFGVVDDNQGVGNTYTRDIQSTAPASGNAVGAIYRCDSIGATSGTFTITVRMSTAGPGVGYAFEEIAADQSGSPIEQSTTTNDNATNTSSSSGTTSATSRADCSAYAVVCNEAAGLLSEAYTANASGSNPSTGWTTLTETDNNNFQCGAVAYRILTATGAINHTWTLGTAATDSAGIIVYKAAILEQEGFRFRKDDGSESTATWMAAQDTNVTHNAAMRLRTIVNTTGDIPAKLFRLKYRLVGDDGWRDL